MSISGLFFELDMVTDHKKLSKIIAKAIKLSGNSDDTNREFLTKFEDLLKQYKCRDISGAAFIQQARDLIKPTENWRPEGYTRILEQKLQRITLLGSYSEAGATAMLEALKQMSPQSLIEIFPVLQSSYGVITGKDGKQ